MKAQLLDADTALDVALLKVDAKDLPSAKLGDSNNLLVGEWALAMGNPFGNLIGDPTPTVTLGVISALKRSFRPNGEINRVYMDMIQTDAAINPGNSGGALINSAGELVGINTFIMSRSGGAEGIGFAIPVNRVKAVMQEILLHGKVRSRVMDFRVQNLTPSVAKMVGSEVEQGAVVSEIAGGGPAEDAGFRKYDVVTKVDGRPVKDAQDFALYLWTQQVGTKVHCEVERKGKKVGLTYMLTEAPK
jgi:serine protease Do